MAPIRPVLRDAGVTEQQWRVLRVLADEGLSDASALGTSALLHAPSVTRILKELTDRELISRESDPADGRRVLVEITSNGQDLVDAVGAQTRTILDQYKEAFGDVRLQGLLQDLLDLSNTIRTSQSM